MIAEWLNKATDGSRESWSLQPVPPNVNSGSLFFTVLLSPNPNSVYGEPLLTLTMLQALISQFTCGNQFNPNNKIYKVGMNIALFYRWGNWGIEKLSILLRVTQPVGGRTGM